MKFVVNGEEYPLASVDRLTGAVALEMTRQTKLGVRTLVSRMEEMDRLGYNDAGEVEVLPAEHPGIVGMSLVTESAPHFQALLAFVWVSKWCAGAREPFAAFLEFPLASLDIVADEDDEVAEDDEPSDPTSPSGGSESPDGDLPDAA